MALGQFQHALDELLAWLTHTEELLSEQRKACGDPKAIEIELAKHHVRLGENKLIMQSLSHRTTSIGDLTICHFFPFARCCRTMCWLIRPQWRR